MRRKLRVLFLSMLMLAGLGVSAPSAQAEPGPSDKVLDLILCEDFGGPAPVGLVRFRELSNGQQRGRAIIFSGGPADTTVMVQGRGVLFEGRALSEALVLDGGGGGKLDLRGQFVINGTGAGPAVNVRLGGVIAVSSHPAKEC